MYEYMTYTHSGPVCSFHLNVAMISPTNCHHCASTAPLLPACPQVLRELFSYKPPVTKEQFFSSSFIERKIIMCTEVLSMVRNKHKSMTPRPAARAAPKTTMSPSTQPLVRVASARVSLRIMRRCLSHLGYDVSQNSRPGGHV